MIIMGLTGGFHFGSDAAATILSDGVVLSSVEEERVSRVKNSFSIPPTRCISIFGSGRYNNSGCGSEVVLYTEGYSASEQEMEEHLVSLFWVLPKNYKGLITTFAMQHQATTRQVGTVLTVVTLIGQVMAFLLRFARTGRAT